MHFYKKGLDWIFSWAIKPSFSLFGLNLKICINSYWLITGLEPFIGHPDRDPLEIQGDHVILIRRIWSREWSSIQLSCCCGLIWPIASELSRDRSGRRGGRVQCCHWCQSCHSCWDRIHRDCCCWWTCLAAGRFIIFWGEGGAGQESWVDQLVLGDEIRKFEEI